MVLVLTLVVVVMVVLVLVWAVSAYNRLVRRRNQVEAASAQIDVQLKRRHDLIPNLVETVKGYAAHESGTLDAVVRARQSAVAADGAPVQQRAAAENELTQVLSRLLAVAEAYPDLKASQNFGALQAELATTEDKIAYARQFLNNAVQTFNTSIETVPTNIVAGVGGFRPAEYFEVRVEERGNVSVQF
ncbi:LemA family protein [Kineosporia succinea]|uniref:LemA protein n=1 Tax=Kineosporia succinea TaxID=84632 RepID=A0ABT9P3M5_9ACTN|nr:LemA family protein [Kineosporia succinea]MDP9827292.1 LemA protein [Kineosporia succinea]